MDYTRHRLARSVPETSINVFETYDRETLRIVVLPESFFYPPENGEQNGQVVVPVDR